jgi:hypothetical protein
MTTAPIDVALAYHRAWTTNAIDRAMSLVADDIQCHAPGVELDGKEQYRAFIEGFATGTASSSCTTPRPR